MTETSSEAGTTSAASTTGGGGRTSGSRAASAYESARAKTSEAYSGLRERTGETIESSPMIAVAGGFAVGAVLAAVLPRTGQEERLFGNVGRRINDAAREAAHSAADAGREKVEEITRTAKAKVGEVVIDAVSATTGAATGSKS